MTTATTPTQAQLDAEAHDALQAAGGNATKAAETLGIARTTLNGRIKRHEARTAQDQTAEQAPASPFAADPDNPTDDELAAAVERGLANGTLIDAADWMAQHADDAPAELPDPVHHGDVFSRIEASNPEVRLIDETETGFRFIQPSHHGGDGQPPASPATEDPDESVTALLEDGEPAAEETAPASEQAPDAQPAPARVNWTRQAGRKNVEVNFPEGVATPAAFRHYLISETLAPGTLRIQGVYNMLGRKGFPVRHYDADGGVYDTPQDRDGVRVTRPGVDLAAARDWYAAKHATQA